MEDKDGGPAYPLSGRNLGMSLRDWLAGQALMGIVSNGEILKQHGLIQDDVAKDAYRFADAMLAERGKAR